jgi:outer membrane protein assembly factor BamA
MACIQSLRAQDVPANEPPQAEASETQQTRIVQDRPHLYLFKRVAHPLSWFEAGVRPVFRSAQGGLIHRLASRPPAKYVRVGFNGGGAGSGFGPQVVPFAENAFGRGIYMEAPLLYTYKRYELYQLNTKVPLVSDADDERLSLLVSTGYRSRTADKFFGLGNENLSEAESEYRAVSREGSAGLSLKMSDAWESKLLLSYANVGITRPNGSHSTQQLFGAEIPGLFTGAKLGAALLSIEHDNRNAERLASKGGLQRTEISLNEGLGTGDFGYWKYRFDVQQFFALSQDQRKVIAMRGSAETNQERGGSGVPFWDMPVVGNWDTVRGLENYRYRDKSLVSFSLEYRYRIWHAMDWALFLDEAQVAPEPGDFKLNGFHQAYGVRLIMKPRPNVPITFDIGHGEKWRFFINFNPSF